MVDSRDLVVRTYSERASEYEQEGNLESCWGQVATRALQRLGLKDRYRTIVDLGCGAGQALRELSSRRGSGARLIGIEPAANLRARARANLEGVDNVSVIDGRFECIPLETDSVDFLYSVLAFHWVTDLQGSVRELARVLKPDGEMELFFVGRDSGHDFVTKTTPIFLKHMGLAWLVESAKARKHLDLDQTLQLFLDCFAADQLTVDEEHRVYYDDLEGHWSWWVPRLGAHFAGMPQEKRDTCDREARAAIASLATPDGIPYQVHLLHVQLQV